MRWIALALLIAAAPLRAQPVDLLLVLAVDASGSIDADEFQLQREGYAQAVTDPRVLGAVRSGPLGAIGVAMVEWGAPGGAATVVPWTRLDGAATAADLAKAIMEAPRSLQSWNAIGDGIDLARQLLAEAPWPTTRRVIDVSGDGPDMRSRRPATLARDAAVAQGITINALAIITSPAASQLELRYEREVIGGPGAFVMSAQGRGEFATAILNKLVREIAAVPGATRPVAAQQAP